MTLEDLLRDPSFKNWADGSSGDDAMKWDTYLTEHSEEEEMLMTARDMVRSHPFAASPVEEAIVSEAWQQTKSRIHILQSSRRQRLMRITGAAAIGLLLISISTVFIFVSNDKTEVITIASGPGEVQTLTLDDGSVVTLNGNSEIQYPSRFTGDTRVVTLKGEAFFDVNHLANESPFIVNTNEVEVKVLGTKFNVNAHRLRPFVSLVEGKVEIKSKRRDRSIMLKPGQTAKFKLNIISVIDDDVHARISWREHLWTFDETPLSEVLISLQETFGVKTVVDPGVDILKTISGRLSTKDRRTLYRAMEAMFGVEIIESKYSIDIKNAE